MPHARHAPFRRRVALPCLAAVLAVVGVLLAGRAWAAPPVAVDVDVMLVVEIQDTAGWLTLHQEVLGAVTETARALVVALPARTGGHRVIGLERPKFTVSLAIGPATRALKVVATGKVNGADALTVVTPFQQAAVEVQAGAAPNELTLVYGLSGVVGRLLELHISRP